MSNNAHLLSFELEDSQLFRRRTELKDSTKNDNRYRHSSFFLNFVLRKKTFSSANPLKCKSHADSDRDFRSGYNSAKSF